MKSLADYAKAAGARDVPPSASSLFVSEVSNDSRFKGRDWLFCAIPGAKRDGHDFVKEAVSNGAVAAIVSKPPSGVPSGFPLLHVEDPHLAWAVACETRFDKPAASMILSGVTGTNGKTTIAFLLRRLIDDCVPGAKCGLLSTVLYDSRSSKPVDAARTTPDAWELQRLFSEMRESSCTHVALEASSHGLHQRRLGSALFKTAVFTNLTGDHLDYHHDMESYYQAKRLLFFERLASDGVAVINVDDSYGARLFGELAASLPSERLIACSQNDPKARCLIKSMRLRGASSDLELSLLGRTFKLRSRLIGEHNVYNLASAAVAALTLGADPEKLVETLSGPLAVPGRLEAFELPSGAMAFVDYAHTDDALSRVLSALRPLCEGSLLTVFGCGGDRDKTKRPRMGSVAAKLADKAFVTSDNPRSEDPLEIIAQVVAGVPFNLRGRCVEIPDRREAISSAVAAAKKGDIILVAGKGHESYQEAKGVKIHFDDREILLSSGARPHSA